MYKIYLQTKRKPSFRHNDIPAVNQSSPLPSQPPLIAETKTFNHEKCTPIAKRCQLICDRGRSERMRWKTFSTPKYINDRPWNLSSSTKIIGAGDWGEVGREILIATKYFCKEGLLQRYECTETKKTIGLRVGDRGEERVQKTNSQHASPVADIDKWLTLFHRCLINILAIFLSSAVFLSFFSSPSTPLPSVKSTAHQQPPPSIRLRHRRRHSENLFSLSWSGNETSLTSVDYFTTFTRRGGGGSGKTCEQKYRHSHTLDRKP